MSLQMYILIDMGDITPNELKYPFDKRNYSIHLKWNDSFNNRRHSDILDYSIG